MVQKIKNLRVDIDGFSQLTKSLTIETLDLSLRRDGEVFEDFVKRAKEEGLTKSTSIIRDNIKACINSLNMSKAWLGKLLGEFGTENPYGSGYKTKEDIKPTADVKDLSGLDKEWQFNTIKWSDSTTTIEKLDWLRSSIEEVCNVIKYLGNETEGFHNVQEGNTITSKPKPVLDTREKNICRTNSWSHLCEAKMHLGFELGAIRDAK